MQDPTSPPVFALAGLAAAYSINFIDRDGHVRKLCDIERDLICLALLRSRGSVPGAAAELGIGRSTLYRKLAELELWPAQHAAQAA